MQPMTWIPLLFVIVFAIVDVAIFWRMIHLLKKYQDETVEDLGDKLMPYLHATMVVSVLMGACMIIVTVMRYT